MADTLEASSRKLIEAKNFAHVATIRKDGSAAVIPVWVHTDGEHIVVNTAQGRAWERNLERDPRVTVTVTNMENPYEYVTVRGHVAERTTDDADAVIDSLAKKYLNADTYPYRQAGEQRVTIRIAPDKVMHWGR